MLFVGQAKFDTNLFHLIFRLLNLLLRKWKMGQLETKTETKKSYIFTLQAYDYLNNIPADLRGEPTKKVEKYYR